MRQGVSARAFLGVSPYAIHTREKIRLHGSFLSSSNLFTFLAPWAGDYSLRSGVGYSLCSVVVRTPRAYLFSPLKISPEAGEVFGWSCRSKLDVVIIDVVKDIAYKSAALRAIGHFSQEVREIEPGPKMADERFAHSNRFSNSMVANRVALLL